MPELKFKPVPYDVITSVSEEKMTVRSTNADAPYNANLINRLQAIVDQVHDSNLFDDGVDFGSYDLENLQKLLTQVVIRFDNDPNYYTKRDYQYLIWYLCKSLKYLENTNVTKEEFLKVVKKLKEVIDILQNQIDNTNEEISALTTVVSDLNIRQNAIEEDLQNSVSELKEELTYLRDYVNAKLESLQLEIEGSIKKAVADAKTELIDDATEDGNTLGKLEDRIETIVANEKTYSIAKVESGLGDNVKEAFKLVDEDGTQVGETINIYKDSSLISIELTDANAEGVAGQYIKYTYVLASGEESVQYVNVSRLLAEAEFKNGLEVSTAGEVNVKVDAASEAFLTVGADGVKLSGVQDAIDTAKGEAIAAIAPAIAALDATVGSQTVAEGKHVAVEVVETDGVLTGLTVVESDIASAEALATLDAEVQEHEIVVAAALNDLNARVDGYDTRFEELEGALADKNVAAESTTPDYVTATAADNKVTVAATQKVIDAVALAETSVQTITSDNTCLTAVKTGNNVALSLVWEEGSF